MKITHFKNTLLSLSRSPLQKLRKWVNNTAKIGKTSFFLLIPSYLDCPVEMLHSSRCPVLRDFDLSLHTGSACFEVRLAGGDMWLSLKLASLPSSF